MCTRDSGTLYHFQMSGQASFHKGDQEKVPCNGGSTQVTLRQIAGEPGVAAGEETGDMSDFAFPSNYGCAEPRALPSLVLCRRRTAP